jgi:Mu transposase-like protein
VIEVDGNAYSVPWRLIGESVRVPIAGELLRVSHGGAEVAVHAHRAGRFHHIVDPTHFAGVVGFGAARREPGATAATASTPALLRPLAESDRLMGGSW